MPDITLRLDADDFIRLTDMSSRWTGDWRLEQEERWETIGADEEIRWDFGHAHWVGPEWTNVIFARHFLDAIGEEYQIIWDMAENPDMSWVILTNYAADSTQDESPESAAPATGPQEEHGSLWYTHWAYFASGSAAEACRGALTDDGFDAVVKSSPSTAEEGGAGDDQWLLQASKVVNIDDMVTRHAHVEEIVTRHGGLYDGGCTGRHDDMEKLAAARPGDGPAPEASTGPAHAENQRPAPRSPLAWRQNTAVPPPGWDRLTDSDGTQPAAWFTAASDGMRTVVSGYPTWADSPYDKPDDGPECHHHHAGYDDGDDELDFEEEQEAVLAGIFDVAYRAYVFPDVAPESGPVTHSFTNLDFCGGWRPPVDSPAAETEALLARTVAGAKPASEVFFFGEGAVAERERWISAAREVGLGALPYRLRMATSISERLWLAPARLGDRVDRAALSEAWEALLDADHDRGRARSIAAAVVTGLETAFTLDLLPPLDPKRPYEGWPHPWWDGNSPQGLVVLGAVLGYPPASTYSCLAERLGDVPIALPPSNGHEDLS